MFVNINMLKDDFFFDNLEVEPDNGIVRNLFGLEGDETAFNEELKKQLSLVLKEVDKYEGEKEGIIRFLKGVTVFSLGNSPMVLGFADVANLYNSVETGTNFQVLSEYDKYLTDNAIYQNYEKVEEVDKEQFAKMKENGEHRNKVSAFISNSAIVAASVGLSSHVILNLIKDNKFEKLQSKILEIMKTVDFPEYKSDKIYKKNLRVVSKVFLIGSFFYLANYFSDLLIKKCQAQDFSGLQKEDPHFLNILDDKCSSSLGIILKSMLNVAFLKFSFGGLNTIDSGIKKTNKEKMEDIKSKIISLLDEQITSDKLTQEERKEMQKLEKEMIKKIDKTINEYVSNDGFFSDSFGFTVKKIYTGLKNFTSRLTCPKRNNKDILMEEKNENTLDYFNNGKNEIIENSNVVENKMINEGKKDTIDEDLNSYSKDYESKPFSSEFENDRGEQEQEFTPIKNNSKNRSLTSLKKEKSYKDL